MDERIENTYTRSGRIANPTEQVEWKKLGEICKVQRGKRLTKNLLNENASYPVFHGGLEPLGRFHQFNREADTVMVINVGASAGTVGYSNCQFWSSDGCFCISHSELLNNKYLFYYLQTKTHFLQSQVRHAGIPTLDNLVVEKINLPILSLKEQNRIVGILDTFMDSIENLKQQIDQRRKQYEHYRDQLLDLEGKEGVEMKTIQDVCESNRGVRVIKKELKESGDFPVFQNSITPMGYYHKCNYKKPTPFVITAGAAGEVGFCDTPFWAADDCLCLTCSEKVLSKYVFYFLSKKNFYLKSKVRKGAIPRLSRKVVETLIIPIINTELQKVIIKQLDTFEASISNLEAQLAQRQKQYEYYRNQLLTFE